MLIFIPLFIILLILIFIQYNSIIKLKLKVQQSKSTIDVYCQQRFDLIPNLVEVVKTYKRYEENIEAYCVDEEHQNYGASITYGNGYYNIFGSFTEQNEFLEIFLRLEIVIGEVWRVIPPVVENDLKSPIV